MNNDVLDENEIKKQAQNIQKYYEKPDSDEGYIEDDLAIELEKVKRFKDVMYNDMLGDFNENGEYILPESIMQELIDMPKKIDVVSDNGIEARGFLGERVFHFVVTPAVKEENGNAYCYLVLREEIERMGGYYVDTNSVVVATYDYKFDQFYEQRVREVFNLKDYDGDDTGEEGRAYFADNITARFAELEVMRSQSLVISEKLEELYFNHRIQLLGAGPETALIMAEFTTKRNKLEPFFMNTERKYYFLNQVLDDVLEKPVCKECLEKTPVVKEKMQVLEEKFVEKSVEVQEKIVTSHAVQQVKKEHSPMMVMEEGKPVEKKPEKVQKPGVSKGNSKQSGGGGKGKSGGSKPKGKPGGGGAGKKKDGGKGKGKDAGKPKVVGNFPIMPPKPKESEIQIENEPPVVQPPVQPQSQPMPKQMQPQPQIPIPTPQNNTQTTEKKNFEDKMFCGEDQNIM